MTYYYFSLIPVEFEVALNKMLSNYHDVPLPLMLLWR